MLSALELRNPNSEPRMGIHQRGVEDTEVRGGKILIGGSDADLELPTAEITANGER
jgi:hypothetical protein